MAGTDAVDEGCLVTPKSAIGRMAMLHSCACFLLNKAERCRKRDVAFTNKEREQLQRRVDAIKRDLERIERDIHLPFIYCEEVGKRAAMAGLDTSD